MTGTILFTDRMTDEELASMAEIARKAIRECKTYYKLEYWSGILYEIQNEMKRRYDEC